MTSSGISVLDMYRRIAPGYLHCDVARQVLKLVVFATNEVSQLNSTRTPICEPNVDIGPYDAL